ncbi:MAG TPA: histone deacetylase [bacterium]|nr:histone deacetylase [bacterium]
MRRVGTCLDRRFFKHIPPESHPEHPGRLEVVQGVLERPSYAERIQPLPAKAALLKDLTRIHTRAYLDRLAETAGTKTAIFPDPDTYVSAGSWEAARWAAGGTVAATDAVLDGVVDAAFVFPRPPGHHAEADRTCGFCLVNNIAVAAAHAVEERELSRVLVLDWDLHHGNGTQHSFYARKDVLYMSLHQSPYFPGTGAATEVGSGEGAGYTVNVPIPAGRGDRDYLAVFRDVFLPVALQYRPELVLVSAGFDPYYLDPLGGMKVTAEGFGRMTKTLAELADEVCGGRIVFVLEGGYHLEGLRDSVRWCLDVLTDPAAAARAADPHDAPTPEGRTAIEKAQAAQREFWRF